MSPSYRGCVTFQVGWMMKFFTSTVVRVPFEPNSYFPMMNFDSSGSNGLVSSLFWMQWALKITYLLETVKIKLRTNFFFLSKFFSRQNIFWYFGKKKSFWTKKFWREKNHLAKEVFHKIMNIYWRLCMETHSNSRHKYDFLHTSSPQSTANPARSHFYPSIYFHKSCELKNKKIKKGSNNGSSNPHHAPVNS